MRGTAESFRSHSRLGDTAGDSYQTLCEFCSIFVQTESYRDSVRKVPEARTSTCAACINPPSKRGK